MDLKHSIKLKQYTNSLIGNSCPTRVFPRQLSFRSLVWNKSSLDSWNLFFRFLCLICCWDFLIGIFLEISLLDSLLNFVVDIVFFRFLLFFFNFNCGICCWNFLLNFIGGICFWDFMFVFFWWDFFEISLVEISSLGFCRNFLSTLSCFDFFDGFFF